MRESDGTEYRHRSPGGVINIKPRSREDCRYARYSSPRTFAIWGSKNVKKVAVRPSFIIRTVSVMLQTMCVCLLGPYRCTRL